MGEIMALANVKDIVKRKDEHIRICLDRDVTATYNLLNKIEIVHNPLPEIDLDEIDTSTDFLGASLKAPIIIAGMTGGTSQGKKINGNLAWGASEMGIGMGVGSQRAALADEAFIPTYSVVKEYSIPLILANIGLPQLIIAFREGGLPLVKSIVRHSMEMIGAKAICIHLNYLQEVVQPGGEPVARDGAKIIGMLSKDLPVVVKETGGGMDADTVSVLKKLGVAAIDVGGKGGTSFSAVEYYRSDLHLGKDRQTLGKMLWDWGIPTPVVIYENRGKLPMIATGGVRNGLDVFKLLSLGADVVGGARIFLQPALRSGAAVIKRLEKLIEELKSIMFITGCRTVADIGNAKKIIYPPLTYWFEQGTGKKKKRRN